MLKNNELNTKRCAEYRAKNPEKYREYQRTYKRLQRRSEAFRIEEKYRLWLSRTGEADTTENKTKFEKEIYKIRRRPTEEIIAENIKTVV